MTPEEAMRMVEQDRRIRREYCRKQGYHLDENEEEKRARELREATDKGYDGEADRQLPTGDRT